MHTIVPDIVKHKGRQVIVLEFPYDQPLITTLRTNKEATWSNTLKSWYLPYSAENLILTETIFNGQAIVDMTALRENLKNAPPDIKEFSMGKEAREQITEFKKHLLSRRYSENTIATYTEALTTFLKYYSHKQASDITNGDLIAFNTDYILANNYSASYQNQVVNAVKLFFRITRNSIFDIDKVHRPK